MFILLKTRIFLILCAVCLSTPVSAEKFIEAVGSAAIIEDAVMMAKQSAIKNAMQQAMIQSEAKVDTTSLVSSNVLVVESSRVNAAGTVENVKILDEWIDDGVFFIRIRAQVPADKRRKPSPAARYKKKIGVVQFDVLKREQVQDLPNIEHELPKELIRRLENTDRFIGINATQYLFSNQNRGLPTNDSRIYVQIAEKIGAQIVISGIIRDMGVHRKWFSAYRRIELDLSLYDGISGAKIASHRYSENVKDSDYLSLNTTLFSNTLFSHSHFGLALSQIINRQIEMIEHDLDQIPFSARVIQSDGKTITLNAGSLSHVQVGDSLMTYRLDPDPLYAINDHLLGFVETPVATIDIHQVQPHFAIGKLETKKAKLYPGDIVRFGF